MHLNFNPPPPPFCRQTHLDPMANPEGPEENHGDEDDDAELIEVEEDEVEEDSGLLTHNPCAPSLEELNNATTIDPSYIIHLIRQLLPPRDGVQFDSGDTMKNKFDDAGFSSNAPDELLRNDDDCDTKKPMRGTQEGNQAETIGEANDGTPYSLEHSSRDPWENYGCTIWDLSINNTHADLMVENHLLDVLLMNLSVTSSIRKTEICLGILANLACHEVPRKSMISTEGLLEVVIEHIFTDDSLCLCETFLLLINVLQHAGALSWAKALEPVRILQQILFITENTLNLKLLEKSTELLLTIVDNQGVADTLLQSLMKLGLGGLLTDLLENEISEIGYSSRKGIFRDGILDSVLRLIGALSVLDEYASVFSSNKKVFPHACLVIKHPETDEVSNSSMSAVVLIANLLPDAPYITEMILRDLELVRALLDSSSFFATDIQASHALWSIMARVFMKVQDDPSMLTTYASIVVEKSNLIVETLARDVGKDVDDNQLTTNAKTACLCRMISLLNRCMNECFPDQQVPDDHVKTFELLQRCYTDYL